MASLLDSDRLKTTMTLQKAVTLMKDKYSAEMVSRHVRAINRIAQSNKRGFLLRDLSSLCQLLKECVERLHRFPEYEQPLCRLIAVCRHPFLREKASDETVYTPMVVETLTVLGRVLLWTNSCLVCEHTAASLAAFYAHQDQGEPREDLDVQATRKCYNTALVERSGVSKSVAEALSLFRGTATQIALLQTLLLFSQCATNCNHMLSVEAARVLCSLLGSSEEKLLGLVIEVLWNLLENGAPIQVSEQLSSIECVQTMRSLLHRLMSDGNTHQRRQTRNDVLTLVSLVAAHSPNGSPFVETGLVRDIAGYICSAEDDHLSRELAASGSKVTGSQEDFEFKKMLMTLMVAFSTDPAAILVFSRMKVIRWFLSFVVTTDKAISNWSPAQFEELQLLSLSCLSLLGPCCLGDYMTCQGNTRILLLVEWCMKNQGEQGCQSLKPYHNLPLLQYCLALLLAMCDTGDEALLQDLHEQGIIPILTSLLKHSLQQKQRQDDAGQLSLLSDTLLVLSLLCDNNTHRKELFGGYDGVQLLIECLTKDLSKFSSGLGHHRLLLAATDCTRCAVVGSSIVEDIFLENGGVFALLNLLQMCPSNMQGMLLGMLVDLCDNPKALAHVTSWKGSDQVWVWSLLSRLWREEEKELGVPRDMMGTLAGTTLPLVGASQSAQGMPPLPSSMPSAAIIDIAENIRAKIYALCTKIGFQYPSEGTPSEDKITMCIVENYLDFKTGEVWYEVAGELAQEVVRPVTPDQEGLQEILQCAEERAEKVTKRQHQLMDEQHGQELDLEYSFYEQLRDAQISKERREERQEKLVLRTSNYQQLKEAKQQQMTAIDASRPSAINLGERFHTVDHAALNVTAFSSRHVCVASTPMKQPVVGSDPPEIFQHTSPTAVK